MWNIKHQSLKHHGRTFDPLLSDLLGLCIVAMFVLGAGNEFEAQEGACLPLYA